MARPAIIQMLRVQIVAIPVMVLVLIYSQLWLAGRVPPGRLTVIDALIVALILWRVASFVAIRRQPDFGDDSPDRWYSNSATSFWSVAVAFVGAFWLAMPYANQAEQMLVVLIAQFSVSISAMGTVRRARASLGLAGLIAPTVIPFGIVLYFLVHRGTFSIPIILFTILFCGLQLLLRRALQAAVSQAWDAKADADAQREAKARFLASASHDLGQPLHSARLFFDQAVRGTDPVRRAKAASQAEAAFDAVERQLKNINEHLRLEAGATVPQLAEIAIGALMARVAASFAPAADLVGLKISAIPSRLLVNADPDLLERALSNLVDNTIRHAKARRLLIGARHRGAHVRLMASDDGVGITHTDPGSLFDDYVQDVDHGNEVRGGFGLGLASVRRIASLLGGQGGIEPRWHHGAAFFIELATVPRLNEPCAHA